jgi:transcriptional regulator of nitric oxide reductase
MKKLMVSFFALALIVGASSCKKSYTCQCVNNTTGATSTVSVKASSTTDAAVQCAGQTQGGTSTCAY